MRILLFLVLLLGCLGTTQARAQTLQAGDVITVPISEAIANIKTVPANGQLVRTARDTGISFGAPDEARYHRRP